MPLHVTELVTHTLDLSLPGATGLGDTFYAHPDPGGPLRLRIDFTPAPTHQWDRAFMAAHGTPYDGLALSALHPAHGTVDRVTLSFAQLGTFPRVSVIWDHPKKPHIPWAGGDFTTLREAICDYLTVWWPTTRPAPAARPLDPVT